MTENLPRKLVKRIKGECQHCAQPAVAGSDYCETHGARAAEYDSAWKRTKRQARADAGECITGCGTRVKRAKRSDGTWKLQRCEDCAETLNAAKRDARAMRSVENAGRSVETNTADPAPRGRFKMEPRSVEDQARGWAASTRYVGRSRRGAPSKEDRWRDTLALVTDAITEATATRDKAMPELLTERVVELGRVAKREAHALVADRLLRAARMLMAAAEEVCPGRVAEVEAERGEDNGE